MFSRRDFNRNTSFTAALAAVGQLPLWAAEDGECYPAQGFAKFLKTYRPPNTSVGAGETSYTLINMGKEYGRLTTVRAGAGTYVCDYAIEPGSACKAEFVVKGDLLSGVSSWSLTSRTDPVSKDMAALCVYTETGQVSNGRAVVKAGGTTTSEFTTAVPLLPDWLLPLAAPMLPAKPGNYTFSLLREGTYFLGGQRLLYDGTAKIAVKGGKTLELKNYLHLGEGTLPTNYLVDGNGVTVIVTHGITAEVLGGETMPVSKTAASQPIPQPKVSDKPSPALIRTWVKGNRKKQKDGSFVKMFVTPKGKTVITLRQVDGTEVNIPHKILTPEDLAYLESIQAGIKH